MGDSDADTTDGEFSGYNDSDVCSIGSLLGEISSDDVSDVNTADLSDWSDIDNEASSPLRDENLEDENDPGVPPPIPPPAPEESSDS
jgi:hypothetical protein